MAFRGPDGKLLFENKEMQLVLLRSNSAVESGRDDEEEANYILEFNSIRAEEMTRRNMNDGEARKLISELFPEKISTLTVKLFWQGELSLYRLKMSCVDHEKGGEYGKGPKGDMFKCLRDRFQDNVRISVHLAMTLRDEDTEEIKFHTTTSTEGMTIRNCPDYICEGHVHLDPDLDEDGLLDAQLTVTAHISVPDVEILASTQVVLCKKILDQASFCDVEISTKDGGKVGAHKNFLSACSPVFEAQFGANWKDGDSTTSKVDMSDTSEKGVRAFLRYAYYQDLKESEKDPEIAFELLCNAHKYGITRLESWAIAHLLEWKAQDLNVDLVFAIYTLTRNIKSASKLKSKTAHILMSNTAEMKNLPQYKEMLVDNPDSEYKLHCRIFRDMFP